MPVLFGEMLINESRDPQFFLKLDPSTPTFKVSKTLLDDLLSPPPALRVHFEIFRNQNLINEMILLDSFALWVNLNQKIINKNHALSKFQRSY